MSGTIRKMYNKIIKVLENELDYIPKMELTNSKKYMGNISEKKTKFNGEVLKKEYKIQLSKYYLDCGYWGKKEYEELIDTICHELAHLKQWNHGSGHKELTRYYKEIIYEAIERGE